MGAEPSISLRTRAIFLHHTVDEAPDPRAFMRHCHDMYEIIYVVQGTGRYIVEGTEYIMRPNTLLLLHPHAFHYVEPKMEQIYERYVFHFRETALPQEAKELLATFPTEHGMYGHFYSGARLPQATPAIFASIDRLGELPTDKAELYARFVLSELLILLSSSSPDRSSMQGEPLGLQVVRYLNAHLTEDISLDSLARRFFVSKFYLCRSFREHNGVSVLHYLTEKRVVLAKLLLEQGETAVSAAAKAGFGDYSSFYRAYRKVLGVSPKENKARAHSESDQAPQDGKDDSAALDRKEMQV